MAEISDYDIPEVEITARAGNGPCVFSLVYAKGNSKRISISKSLAEALDIDKVAYLLAIPDKNIILISKVNIAGKAVLVKLSGETEVYGTSFAAPWIIRKLCYLIDVMGLSREVAKALIIDAAAGWEYKTSTYRIKDLVGYGVVPIDIHDILETSNDEIRFVVYGTSESYKTTNYAIPVPRDEDNNYPYIARAAICYFPHCSRSQGVDYTNRELSLKFGRIKSNGSIDDINDNVQDDAGAHVDERASRKEFRKWENTKFISKILKNNRPLKSYDERLWGLSVTSKERLSTRMQGKLNFGAVITLKEIKGINRIQDFITACTLRGWIVNELDIDVQVEVYNTNQEEVIFE